MAARCVIGAGAVSRRRRGFSQRCRAPLDGELWLGRGRFEPLAALVRRRELRDADWQAVRYMVFDTPIAGPSFAVRLENLAAMASQLGAPIEIAPQWHVADRAELERALAVLPRGALQAEAAP